MRPAPFLLAFLSLSLAGSLAAEWRTSVRGRLLSGPHRGDVVLERVDRQHREPQEITRVELTDGRLALEFLQTEPALYRLLLPKGRRLELALEPGERLVFEYDPVSRRFSSTGSRGTAELARGVGFDRGYVRENVSEPEKLHAKASKKGNATAIADARTALAHAKKTWFAALVDHLATLDSALAVYGIFTLHDWNRELSDVDLAGIEAVHQGLATADPDSVGVELLADLIGRYRRTAVGAALPDVILKDPDGRIIKTSDLRGRYVLVDLWASECEPCRRESPKLLASYEKYRDEGFTIYSVSFDEFRDRWLKAIKKEGRDWPFHVSDLDGSRSEAGYVYATAPPSNFLLDAEGRIVAKNRHGEALRRKLTEIYGF